MPAVNRYYSSVAIDTTLKFSITNSDLTLDVNSTSGFPTSYPYTLAIGYDLSNEELVTIIGASGTTLTVGTTVAGGANIAGRGVDGTNDQAHAAGEPVKHVISARDMTETQAHIAAEAGAHGITGSFVGTTDTQTLTNKTITGGTVNPTTLQQGGVPVATTTGTQTLTNKTVNLTSNTLTGTIAEFNTALSDADFATTTTTQTLTNKTLTSPVITGGTINSGVALTVDSTELNKLDGVTATTAQLNYINTTTSDVQTQLNAKASLSGATFTGTVTLPTSGNGLAPVGSITMWATATPPTGWLLCNGQSTTGYTALAAIVGSTVPDMQGFVPVGFKTSDDAFGTLKGTGGSKTSTAEHTHDIDHNHDSFTTPSTEGSHSHGLLLNDGSGTGTGSYVDSNPTYDSRQFAGGVVTGAGLHQHTVDVPALGTKASGASSVAATNGNLQPYFTLNFIIKH